MYVIVWAQNGHSRPKSYWTGKRWTADLHRARRYEHAEDELSIIKMMYPHAEYEPAPGAVPEGDTVTDPMAQHFKAAEDSRFSQKLQELEVAVGHGPLMMANAWTVELSLPKSEIGENAARLQRIIAALNDADILGTIEDAIKSKLASGEDRSIFTNAVIRVR